MHVLAVVTLLAGSGTGAFANGIGSAAQFNAPSGVFCVSSGTCYVNTINDDRIRQITTSGA